MVYHIQAMCYQDARFVGQACEAVRMYLGPQHHS